MSKAIYDELFKFYVIRRDSKNIRNIRTVIRDRFKKEFPSKAPEEWEDLTDIEKDYFKLITMRDYLTDKSGDFKKVKKNFKDTDNRMLKAYKLMQEQNQYISKLYKQYFDESATVEKQHEAYEEFCKDLNILFPQEQTPHFEEWKKHPLRLYDIQQSLIDERLKELQTQKYYNPISQNSIDHIVIECICKIIQKELKITIDIDSIKHCLEMSHYTELVNSSQFNSSNEKHLDLLESIQRLNELDFMKKEGNGTD